MAWGSWSQNWGSRTSRTTAAYYFLQTGDLNTALGGSQCFSSSDCASGYYCSGGRCVQNTSNSSSSVPSGCGDDSGGGGCTSVSRTGADGCTIPGCSTDCGSGSGDCPGTRTCRFDAFGTVNCFCGEPTYSGCSSFCTAYANSNGETADGCSGLACDECSYCDESFVAASGQCRPINNCNKPCHCNQNTCLADCEYCADDGTVQEDNINCGVCYTVYKECPCGTFTKTCCYTRQDAAVGLSPVNRCQNSINCAELCNYDISNPSVDPCAGTCVQRKTTVTGTCPSQLTTPVAGRPTAPAGHEYQYTGCIQVGSQATWFYWDCDVTDVPDQCARYTLTCTQSREAAFTNSIVLGLVSGHGPGTLSFGDVANNSSNTKTFSVSRDAVYELVSASGKIIGGGTSVALEDSTDNDYNDLAVTCSKGAFNSSGSFWS